MTPRETAARAVEALPPDASWDEVLRAIRNAAGYADGGITEGAAAVRETGPAWSVEQPAEHTTGGMTMRSYDVVVERDEEGWLVGSVPGLRGCHTQARSMEALLERIREAIAVSLEAAGDAGTRFVAIRRVTVPA